MVTDIEKWSWSNDKEDIVIPRVDAIAIYLNGDGDIVIRQENPMGEDDAVIVMPMQHAEAFIAAIRGCIERIATDQQG